MAEPVARTAEGLFAFFAGREAPERPQRVKITGEDGNVKEVFVPPGEITHFDDWLR